MHPRLLQSLVELQNLRLVVYLLASKHRRFPGPLLVEVAAQPRLQLEELQVALEVSLCRLMGQGPQLGHRLRRSVVEHCLLLHHLVVELVLRVLQPHLPRVLTVCHPWTAMYRPRSGLPPRVVWRRVLLVNIQHKSKQRRRCKLTMLVIIIIPTVRILIVGRFRRLWNSILVDRGI